MGSGKVLEPGFELRVIHKCTSHSAISAENIMNFDLKISLSSREITDFSPITYSMLTSPITGHLTPPHSCLQRTNGHNNVLILFNTYYLCVHLNVIHYIDLYIFHIISLTILYVRIHKKRSVSSHLSINIQPKINLA